MSIRIIPEQVRTLTRRISETAARGLKQVRVLRHQGPHLDGVKNTKLLLSAKIGAILLSLVSLGWWARRTRQW